MDRNYSVGTVLASAAAVVLTEAALRFLRFKPKPKLKGPTGAAAMAAAAAESRDPCPARRQLAALEIAEETAAALASPRCAPTSPVFRADSPGGFYTRSDGTLRKMRGTSSSSGSRGAVNAQLLAERKTSQEPESRSAGRDRRDQGEEGRTVEVQRGEGIDAGVAGYPPPPLAVSEAGQRDHEGGQREVLPLTPLSPRVGLDLNLGCDDDAAVVEDVFSKIADCLSPRADVAAAGTLAGAVRRGNDPRQLRRATSTLHDMTKSKILQNLLVRDQVEETFDSFPYYVGEDTKEALITSSFIHLKRASLSECINLKDFRASSSTILLCGPAESIVYMQKLAKAVGNHYGANFLYVDTSILLPSSQAFSRSSTRMRRTSFPSGFGKRGGDAVSGEERGRGVSSSASSVNLLSAGTEASAAGNEAAGEETKPKPRGMHRRCRSEAVLVGKENRHPASVMELEDWDIESLTASGLLMDERAQRRIIIEALFEVLEMPMNFGEPTVVLIRDPGDALFNDVSSCLFFKDKVERHEGPSVFFKTATETQSNSKRQKLQDVEGASGTQKEEACEDFDKLAKLVFPKKIAIQPPKEPEKMSEWRKQLDADIKCTLIEDNKNFLAAFLQENGVICQDVGKLSMTDIPLTQKDAEEIVGWAVTSYLMHTAVPDHHDGRLVLPFERLECGLKRFLARRRENDGAEAALRKSEVSEKTSTAKKSTDPATEKRTEAESAKARQGPSSTSSGERTLDTAKPSSEPEKKTTATTATSTTPAASTEPAKKPVTAAPKEPEPAADNEFEKKIRSEMIAPGRVGVSFDDIGALDKVKQTLRELVMLPLKRPEIFSRGKLMKPCKGILLFGPPGTGKTMLAKAVATEAGASFLNVSMSTITSKWFGEDEKNVRALFTLAAKVAPTIVFIDEVDSMLGRRTRVGEHEAMRKIKNEFMSHWDGLTSQEDVRVLILAATNRPFDLDDAIIRRFQRRLMVGLPDAANRALILNKILANEELAEPFDFEELAAMSEGFSGSDLKNWCMAAAYRPIREMLDAESKAREDEKAKPSAAEGPKGETKDSNASPAEMSAKLETDRGARESPAEKTVAAAEEGGGAPTAAAAAAAAESSISSKGGDHLSPDIVKHISSKETVDATPTAMEGAADAGRVKADANGSQVTEKKTQAKDTTQSSSGIKKSEISVVQSTPSSSSAHTARAQYPRALSMDDMRNAKKEVCASVASGTGIMKELEEWNEQYGEGGSGKKKEQLTYFM